MTEVLDIKYWKQYDINELEVVKYLQYIINIKNLGDRQLEYFEFHHIIPKSVNKDLVKDSDNIIKLSGREHFIAHQLLLSCFNGKLKSSMYYSYNLMCNSLHNNHYNISDTDYELFRKDFHKLCSINNSGKNNPMYGRKISEKTRQKLKLAKKDKYNGCNNPMYNVHRTGKDNPMYGRKQTVSTKQKIGNNSKNRIWINNGINNKFIKPEDIQYYESLGFIYKGCIMNKK